LTGKVEISNVGRELSLEACVEFADLSRIEPFAQLLPCLCLQNLQRGKVCAANKGSFDVKTWDRCPDTGRWSTERNPQLIGSGLECTLAEGQLLSLLSRNNIVYFYLTVSG